MHRIFLAARAEQDIDDLLTYTVEKFGSSASNRYATLISVSVVDVATAPLRAESVDRSELGDGLRSLHLRHSRGQALQHGASVKHPRHVLFYRLTTAETVEVVRVLHDSMDFNRHLAAGDAET
jgi:toxin ParE1/3/4